MLKVKKLLEKVLSNFVQIQKKEYTVTTGSSEYSGYYYSDVPLNVPSGFNFLCIGSVRTQNNSFAACQNIGWTLRVWSSWAQTQVNVVAYFIKIGGGYCIAVFSRLSAVLERWWRHAKPQENLAENIAGAHGSAKADDAFSTAFSQPTTQLDVHGASRRNIVSRVRVIRKNLHQRNMERRQFAGHSNRSACEYISVDDELFNTYEEGRHGSGKQSFRELFPNKPHGIRCVQVPRLALERGCFSC